MSVKGLKGKTSSLFWHFSSERKKRYEQVILIFLRLSFQSLWISVPKKTHSQNTGTGCLNKHKRETLVLKEATDYD